MAKLKAPGKAREVEFLFSESEAVWIASGNVNAVGGLETWSVAGFSRTDEEDGKVVWSDAAVGWIEERTSSSCGHRGGYCTCKTACHFLRVAGQKGNRKLTSTSSHARPLTFERSSKVGTMPFVTVLE